jgi:hypothetical protein
VIDEEAKTVERSIPDAQKLGQLCWGDLSCALYVSPGSYYYSVSGIGHDHSIYNVYEFDRKSGKAEIAKSMRYIAGGGSWEKEKQSLTCSPTPIPVFDTSKNKF